MLVVPKYDVSMTALRIQNQFACFAIGSYVGFLIASCGELLLRTPTPSAEGHELPFEWLLAMYVPTCLFLSLPYLAWISLRWHYGGTSCIVPWLVPCLLGIIYLPIASASIPLLIRVTGQGRGAIIGSSIVFLLFGLPALFAEIAFRCRQASVESISDTCA
jgi:hypothetical protein